MAELTPDAAAELALRLYGDDEAYDTNDQRLFALLVDVADAYVLAMREEMTERMAEHGIQDSMGTVAGMDAIRIAICGLEENLDMRDEERAKER